MQETQQPTQEEQESLQAENLRTLFRRLYGSAEGEAKLDFIEGTDDFYLAHALIQLALFSVEQYCIISMETQKGCINDGTNAYPMTPGVLKDLGKYDTGLLGLDSTTDTRIKDNPGTRNPIKPETFYFFNCHIEKDFYSKSNLVGERFNDDDFIRYKKQYLQATLIYLGAKNLHENISALFDEIKSLVPNIEATVTLRDLNFYDMRADSIYELLHDLKEINSPLGRAAKTMLDSKEFKDRYEALKEGPIEKLKNFLFKCLLTIYHSLKWLFLPQTINGAKGEFRRNYYEYTKNPKLQDFRDYVTTELKSELDHDSSQQLA